MRQYGNAPNPDGSGRTKSSRYSCVEMTKARKRIICIHFVWQESSVQLLKMAFDRIRHLPGADPGKLHLLNGGASSASSDCSEVEEERSLHEFGFKSPQCGHYHFLGARKSHQR